MTLGSLPSAQQVPFFVMTDRDVSAHGHASVLDALRRLRVTFDVVPCDPALSDTEAFGAAYGYPADRIVNTIVVRSRSAPPAHVACVLLGSTRLDVNGTVRRRMGVRKASFAPADDATALTSMPPGGVSPFGLPPNVPVWVDDRVPSATQPLIVGSGERGSKLLVAPGALALIDGVEIVPRLAVDRDVG
jgi:prolyl-tRNA editing enzyme YbaK/EbsC (Cys-tRNA(Pro) deacylase)